MISSTGTLSIASLYDVCVGSFNQLFNLLQEPNCDFSSQLSKTALEEELGRFRVWAGNSGAHRNGQVSLDHKLREAYHVHQTVRDLLGDLDDALKEAISIVSHERKPFDEQSFSPDSSIYSLEDAPTEDPEEQPNPTTELTELQERFGEVCHVITCLYKLSITIRNPAPRDRLQKCASIKISHFEFFDIQHAREKFPGAQDFLQDRLGKANTKRRQLLKYHERHHGKLAQYIDFSLPKRFPTIHYDQKDENSGDNELKITKDGEEDISERRSQIEKGPGTIAETENTQTTISTYVQGPSDQTVDVITLDDALSQTSYATSTGGARSTIHVPLPPNAAETLDGKPFECPYCYSIISVSSRNLWIKHVYRDLRPYVCTFEDCLKPDRLFDTRHDWYNHEVEVHRREWFCNICRQSLSNKTIFENHLRQSHPKLFTEAQMPAMAERCERAIDLEQICPLCGENHTSHRLKSHLARHMQQLALFTLPKTVEETDGHGESLGAQASRSDEEGMEDDLNEVELDFDSDPSQGSADNILDAGNEITEEIAETLESDPAIVHAINELNKKKPPAIVQDAPSPITRYVCFQKRSSALPWKNEWETCDPITMSISPEETEKHIKKHDEPGRDIDTCISKLGKYQLRHLRKQEDKLNKSEKDVKNFKWVVSAVGEEKEQNDGASHKFWAIYSRQSRSRPVQQVENAIDNTKPLYLETSSRAQELKAHIIQEMGNVNLSSKLTEPNDYDQVLISAAENGYEKLVEMLVEIGADFNAQGGVLRKRFAGSSL
ncbi:hypothetical protein P167DRAFT_353330 [Morchella conica CCBAS932]|uniref:C2H2-type domain-containing protein n=1 Tax=Morchella conica CCBAS932 TaxID=1392247 RepID=A0A3N4L046_9PEZI|nr:hypothetical protein P167DRAFT_353330 [Morchella conica CCBAS932]